LRKKSPPFLPPRLPPLLRVKSLPTKQCQPPAAHWYPFPSQSLLFPFCTPPPPVPDSCPLPFSFVEGVAARSYNLRRRPAPHFQKTMPPPLVSQDVLPLFPAIFPLPLSSFYETPAPALDEVVSRALKGSETGHAFPAPLLRVPGNL